MAKPLHCANFSRTAFVRKAISEAGRGLPAIEPGMPLPAGTGLDRRTFVSRSVGALLAVYGATRLAPGALEAGVARAASGASPILVSVFLEGGADSLSLLAPVSDPLYAQYRRTLAIKPGAGGAFQEDASLQWHPKLSPLERLYAEGKVAVAPSIGYVNANQSHFTSRHFWEVGSTNAALRTGWLGRYLDYAGSPDNPLQGLSLDGLLSPTLAPARVPVAVCDGPDRYAMDSPNLYGEIKDATLDTLETFGGYADPAMAKAATVAAQAEQLRAQLGPFKSAGGFGTPVQYPRATENFPRRLAGLAAMIGRGLPLRCVALSAPGVYDTHSGQAGALAAGLDLTASSLLAFQRDLEARGVADRVLTLVWSEFGRRAQENGSGGTDHGAAGTAFLIGTRVRSGMIGEFAGLTKLDALGNLRATSDFRGLYASILEQWFSCDAAAVVPSASSFARYALVK